MQKGEYKSRPPHRKNLRTDSPHANESNLYQLQTLLNNLSMVTTSGKHLQGPFKTNFFFYFIDLAFLGLNYWARALELIHQNKNKGVFEEKRVIDFADLENDDAGS